MRDRDYSCAGEFLAQFFAGTDHAVELRALGDGPPAIRFTRDPEIVADFCTRYDVPGRGCYFAVATRRNGSHTGKRSDLAELPGVWVEIDCYKFGTTKETVVAALRLCPLPPTIIIDSGGGIHAYWLFREAMDARLAADRPDSIKDDVDAVLRQLAGVFAGDIASCDITRILRLPGTSNWKTGEARPVALLHSEWERRYEFSDLVETLDWLRPLIEVPAPFAPDPVIVDDPFTAYAARAGIRMPIDVEARLTAMSYMGAGEAGIHQTQLQVSASMVRHGADDNETVELLLSATKSAAGLYGARWNWRREEDNIRRMTETAREKYGKPIIATSTATAPYGERATDERATQETQQQAVGNGHVVDLAGERAKRRGGRAKTSDNPLIARCGDAVIEWWKDTRGLLAIVAGQPYTYSLGIWNAWTRADIHALKAGTQGVLKAAEIDPKTQLLNAIARYVIERPDLMHDSVDWDNSGLIVCQDVAIDPLSLQEFPHSPEHWATGGAAVRFCDIGRGCASWAAFLDGCFSNHAVIERRHIIEALQEYFGAALVKRKARELRKALWLYGESRTGKTRILEVLRLLIGDPLCSLKVRALEKNFGASALLGKRGWIADDAVGAADEIDDALFKVIVTGEAVSVDVKNSAHDTGRFDIPVAFSSNPLPRVKDQSDAVFNRLVLIHMQVVRSEEETAGKSVIEDVVRRDELAAVFAWSLAGWARLSARGRYLPPQSMQDAAAEFKAANNIVGTWAKDCLAAASQWMVDRRDLYASFEGWYMSEHGRTAKVPSQKFLIGSIRQCMHVDPDHKASGARFMTALKLTDEGLLYRRESGREAGVAIGSAAAEQDVNRPRPQVEQGKSREPRF